MRIVLFGATGQLGTSLQQRLDDHLITPTRDEVDLTAPEQIRDYLATMQPDAVVNAAAYNLVDQAETNAPTAWKVNCEAPAVMAECCRLLDVPLLHVSTDYVFDGEYPQRIPHTEESVPEMRSQYAQSKGAGEAGVRNGCEKFFIVRTCGLFGPTKEPGRGNFVETMLRVGTERGEVSVVNDQTCTPTSTADLAHVLQDLLQTEAWGLYHCTNGGETTWYDFAKEIFSLAGMNVKVNPITTEEYGAPAPRPSYSVLDCGKGHYVLGWKLRPWQEALAEYLGEWKHLGERTA